LQDDKSPSKQASKQKQRVLLLFQARSSQIRHENRNSNRADWKKKSKQAVSLKLSKPKKKSEKNQEKKGEKKSTRIWRKMQQRGGVSKAMEIEAEKENHEGARECR
jgi:hypothetical protein